MTCYLVAYFDQLFVCCVIVYSDQLLVGSSYTVTAMFYQTLFMYDNFFAGFLAGQAVIDHNGKS